MNDVWESGRAAVMLHVLLNEMGDVAAAARSLLERWAELQASERETLLRMIDECAVRGLHDLYGLALVTGR